MKTPKERQRAYRERRKEQKSAGLTKLKILTSATAAKRLEILSEVEGIDAGTVLIQALDLLWTQRFGNTEAVEPLAAAPEATAKPEKAKTEKPAKAEKAEKPAKVKSEKEKTAKADKPRKKVAKAKGGTEAAIPA